MNDIVVEGPGGIKITFPAGTDQATMDKAMREAVGASTPSAGGSREPAASAGMGPRQPTPQVTPVQPATPPTMPGLSAMGGSPTAPLPTPRDVDGPRATTPAPDPLAPTGGTQRAQRDYSDMHYLQTGMKVTEKGIETRRVKSDQGKGLTDAQRKTLDSLGDWNPQAPPGSRQNPFVAVPRKDGSKTLQPNGPVGSWKLLDNGKLVQQETKYDEGLGFTQETMRATDNVFSLLGNEDSKQARIDRANQLARARLTGVEPGGWGGFAGSMVGTTPYVVATRNPYVGGAIAGAVNTRGDEPIEVLGDAAFGAATGRLADMGMNALADTVAPQIAPHVNRLLQGGVKLTPGQIKGGAAQRVEDAATSIPLMGDMISSMQREATESFNTAAINEAISPAGLNLNRMGPDELINRRGPTPDVTPPGTPARRAADTADVPIGQASIEARGMAVDGPGATKQIEGPKSPTQRAADAAKRAKAAPDKAGDDLIDAELAHREAAEAAAEAGDMSLAKAHEDAADLYQRAYDGESDEVAKKAMNDAIAATEKLGGAQGRDTGKAVGNAVSKILGAVGIRLPPNLKTAAPKTGGQPRNPGTKAPAQFGHDAVEWAHQQLSIKYNNLLQNVESHLRFLDKGAMDEIGKAALDLPGPERAIYDKFVTNYVEPRFKKNIIRGDEWKELDSALGQEIREYGRSLDPNQRKLAAVYRDLQVELREMFAKGVEAGRPAAKLPTKSPPLNQAVDEANLRIITDHGKMVDEWIAGGRKGPMPKSPELLKPRADVDAGFQRGKGGEAVPGDKKFADELRAVDKAYSNLLRIETAASKAPGGVFTAQNLKSAVRELDSTSRKRKTAHGQAPMQQMAEDALQVLSRRVPESGTATRGLINGATFMALAGAYPKLNPNPMLLALLGTMLAPYTRQGGKITRSLMTKRPEIMRKMRPIIENYRDVLGNPTAAGINGMLRELMGRNASEEEQPLTVEN